MQKQIRTSLKEEKRDIIKKRYETKRKQGSSLLKFLKKIYIIYLILTNVTTVLGQYWKTTDKKQLNINKNEK